MSMQTTLPKSFVKLNETESIEIQGKRVLIECEGDKETYGDTGLIKPDQFKRYAKSGWIRALGNDLSGEIDELGINVGDKVFYDCYSGVDIDINGKTHKIIHVDNLMCKEV